MEYWDTYDINGNKTGRVVKRGEKLREGEFHLVVHILPYFRDQYLIQKRSKLKETHPSIWAVTGGSAIRGEDSLEAALRETKEELGIDFSSRKYQKISRLIRSQSLADIWLFECELSVEEMDFNPKEVEVLKWLDLKGILKMVEQGEFFDYGQQYFLIMEKGLKSGK